MPPPDPLTRLLQVALGLDALADELRELLQDEPQNLRWWSREIRGVVDELRQRAARAQ